MSDTATLTEDQRERAEGMRAQLNAALDSPRIASYGADLENSPEDGKPYGAKCPWCSEQMTMTKKGHGVHRTQCEKDFNKRVEERKQLLPIEEKLRAELPSIEQLPEEQPIPYTGQLKNIWGRNNVLVAVLQPQDTRKGGIIIPADTRKVDRTYTNILNASNIGRIIKISRVVDTEIYPELEEWREKLEKGEEGPTIEFMPGAGSPRRGPNGEACLRMNAQHIWGDF